MQLFSVGGAKYFCRILQNTSEYFKMSVMFCDLHPPPPRSWGLSRDCTDNFRSDECRIAPPPPRSWVEFGKEKNFVAVFAPPSLKNDAAPLIYTLYLLIHNDWVIWKYLSFLTSAMLVWTTKWTMNYETIKWTMNTYIGARRDIEL